jgi:hypothetical protein
MFTMKGSETYSSNTTVCLPIVRYVSQEEYDSMWNDAWLILLHVLTRPYIRRLRRLLLAFVYPRRERERVLYLYNCMLQLRQQHFRFMLASAQMRLREKAQNLDPDMFEVFGEMWQKFGRCLCPLARYNRYRQSCLRFFWPIRCCVCDVACRNRPVELNVLFCVDCHNSYCARCFHYLSRMCLLCRLPSLEAEHM